ncbi:MAG: TonB-dependent receptor [Bacteroidales bacterium]|nr:TonB-dependent receptor [Candidatus Liminaster caballi]
MFAQVTVTGVVTETSGEPIIGATVREKGTNVGTITDMDGRYSLKVANAKATLVFSYVGLETIEEALNGRKVVNVELKSNDELLDEVVVVGYGTMKKSDLAGASSSMNESLVKGPGITALDQSLQGHVSGVQAVTTSGAPGSSSSIRVRGQATINAGAEPLYVIDGVIVQSGGTSGSDYGLGDKLGNGSVSTISPLSTINPADIVSMEILKDASATAIYGAQGANGVILITTKRGKAGEAKFTYDGSTSWSRQMTRIDMLNLREFAEYYNDLVAQGEIYNGDPAYSDPSILGLGTNWQDAIFRTAFQQQHQISAQGGTDKLRYYVSGGWMDQEGTIIGTEFQRYSLRSNIDADLKKWLKMGLNISFSSTSEELKKADQEEGLITYSLTTPPDIQIYNIDGGYSSVSKQGFSNPNPIAMAELETRTLDRQKLNGNIFFDVTPIKDLTWHTELGWDLGWNKAETYDPMVSFGTWSRGKNEARMQKNSSLYWSFKNYLTYNGKIGKHSFTAMAGQEAWQSKWDYVMVYNTGLPLDVVHNPQLGTGTPQIGSGFGTAAMASFFTRETYNYDNRYLLTYTYRYDGSSNFGPSKRWAGFHSVAGAWRFLEEGFMKGVKDSGVLSNGKLRLGWGQTGNSNIGGYKWGTAMSIMENQLGTSYRPGNIKNESIHWETQEQVNVGLDLGFLHDRINLVVDVYKKKSSDMLMPLTLPSIMGTSGNGSSALAAPWGNYGDIENKGLEISVNARPIEIGDFSWNSDFQISFNKNKLVSLAGSSALPGYGQWTDVVSRSAEGESLYNFYGYQVVGVYKDFDDIINSPVNTLQQNNPYTVLKDADDNVIGYEWSTDPSKYNRTNTTFVGDLKFKDVNGDGKIDEQDKTNIGSPLPKFTFGWNNTFHYKNWDLNIFVNGSYGNKVGNYTAMKLTAMNSAWTNQTVDVKNRVKLVAIDDSQSDWYEHVENVKVSNPGASIPRATINDPNDNDAWSSRYIEDGSYIRLKTVSLSYTFDKKLIKKIGLENARITLTGNNLVTWTKYSGYDPEIGASTASNNVFGLDNGRYPSPLSFTAGVNVTF